jgi:hypothetical protein
MTTSHGSSCPTALTSFDATTANSTQKSSNSLVGWLIQTALACVWKEISETFAHPRGLTSRHKPQTQSALRFPLNLTQRSLIPQELRREYQVSVVGFVAGRRRPGV